MDHDDLLYHLRVWVQLAKESGCTFENAAKIAEQVWNFLPDPDALWEQRRDIAQKRGKAWVRENWNIESVPRYFGPWWFRLANMFRRYPHLWGG